MKRVYEDPTMDVVIFETENIMLDTSNNYVPDPNNPDGEDEF